MIRNYLYLVYRNVIIHITSYFAFSCLNVKHIMSIFNNILNVNYNTYNFEGPCLSCYDSYTSLSKLREH